MHLIVTVLASPRLLREEAKDVAGLFGGSLPESAGPLPAKPRRNQSPLLATPLFHVSPIHPDRRARQRPDGARPSRDRRVSGSYRPPDDPWPFRGHGQCATSRRTPSAALRWGRGPAVRGLALRAVFDSASAALPTGLRTGMGRVLLVDGTERESTRIWQRWGAVGKRVLESDSTTRAMAIWCPTQPFRRSILPVQICQTSA